MSTTSQERATAAHRSDEDIRAEVQDRVLPGIEDVDTRLVRAAVDDGVVLLVGRLDWDSQAPVVGRAVAEVSGVREVRNRLRCTWDDVTRFPWHPRLRRVRR
ncbi:BON domain-containing protein [Actinokineospora terrae]|uniref:BON domain-containing protein n=1 Tax=Actinokineospora terrae TaxID=155974 RepID=A0A1H9X2I6_9PSEU|nr:BON domain-containing protein [Actinokineospora terrae]SES40097.1 BON domain-containing protein [Actinokineospora terrae]